MKVFKHIIKIIIYFLPVLLIHAFFSILDIILVGMVLVKPEINDLRNSTIHLSVYFLFFVTPLYVCLANIILNIKNDISKYYNDIKYTYFSIMCGNLCTLIINFLSNNVLRIYENNYLAEFFIVFISQAIVVGMLSYMGHFLVDKNYLNNEEEEEFWKEMSQKCIQNEGKVININSRMQNDNDNE